MVFEPGPVHWKYNETNEAAVKEGSVNNWEEDQDLQSY
jgi:hypothetical protein